VWEYSSETPPADPSTARRHAGSTRSASRHRNIARAHGPQTGRASYYANRFHGRKTASGHPYYKDALTAAHRTLPLGTWVKVTNIGNDRSVMVQITDRGPYAGRRIIDLSRRAAAEIGMIRSGTAAVRIEIAQAYAAATADEQPDRLRLASLAP
jgi:rare lipoprotein A